jgi:hypothetical protein
MKRRTLIEQEDEPQKLRVLFLGDSQTAMSSISYAYKLIRNGVVDGNVVAKGGADTKKILSMMRNAIDDSYDVVCILAGSNDAWRKTADFSARNLSAMYNLAHSKGALVIALSNPIKIHTPLRDKYPGAEVIAQWVRSQRISDFVIDVYQLTSDRSNFLPDRIHLNQRGQNIIYAEVKQILMQLQARNSGKAPEIRKTQAKLQRLGYDLGRETELGVSGPRTKKALEDLSKKQQKAGTDQSWSDKAYAFVGGILSSPWVQGALGTIGLGGLFGAGAADTSKTSVKKPSSASSSVSKSTMGKYIVDFFKKKGLTTTQSAGIAGNLKLESGFNVKAVGDNGTSFGLAQWHNERWTNLKSWCAKKGYDPYSADGQLEYLWHELNHSERQALSELKKQNDAAKAAYIFAKYFERPSEISKARLKFAQEIYDDATEDVLNRIA